MIMCHFKLFYTFSFGWDNLNPFPLQKRSSKYTAVMEFAFIWQHYRKCIPLCEWAPMSSLQATVCCQWLSTVKLIIPLHIQQLVSRPLFPLYHTVDTIWSTQAAIVLRNCEAVKEIMHLSRWELKLWQKRGTSLLVLTNCAVIKVWTRKCTRPRKMGDLTRRGGTSSTRTWRHDCDETKDKRAETPLKKHKTTAQNPPPQRRWPSSDKARLVRNYQGQHLTTRHRCWNQGVTQKKRRGNRNRM